MLGYISSTRKKSCYACVHSKRRCDLGYPYCKRCFIKGLDCHYPNAAPRQSSRYIPAEVVIRQRTPDLTPPLLCETSSLTEIPVDIDGTLGDTSCPLFEPQVESLSESTGSSSSPEALQVLRFIAHEPRTLEPFNCRPQPRLTRYLPPELSVPKYLNEEQVFYVINGLCNFVPGMAYTGSTTFLHKNLYQHHQPQAYQDCVALTALYLTKTSRNHRILANSIDSKISSLIAASTTWTLTEHLAAVQALIVYQVIRLFDPDLKLQAEAVKHNPLLERWGAQLCKRFYSEPPKHESCYDSWVFNESVRRTIMVSVSTRCGWSVLMRGGVADLVHVLVRLPITKDVGAWHCEQDEWNRRMESWTPGKERLITYGDLSTLWNKERCVQALDPFEKYLLVACRGGDDPRLLM
jgi:hypothetical protein